MGLRTIESSGVGMIFGRGETATGRVEDADAVHTRNGCFSVFAGGADVLFPPNPLSE